MTKDILRYFLRNPRAADTLEGVAGWRLLDEIVHHRLEVTQKALDWLVSRGFLKQVSTAASGTIYSLDWEHRGTAEDFLAKAEAPASSHGNSVDHGCGQ